MAPPDRSDHQETHHNWQETTFTLFLGNHGFFPASLQAETREELPRKLKEWGHDVLDEAAARYGAVETPREGARWAAFLREDKGGFGGIILCLPNLVWERRHCSAQGGRRSQCHPGVPRPPRQDGAR